MEKNEISNHADLLLQINKLKEEKFRQENELKIKIKALANDLNPISILKSSLHNLATDKGVHFDLVKMATDFGINYFFSKIFGKKHDFSHYMSAILAKNLSKSFINNYLNDIINYFTLLINPIPENETDPNSKE